jgi:hypothetical protein
VDEGCEDLLIDELPDVIDEDYVSSEILGGSTSDNHFNTRGILRKASLTPTWLNLAQLCVVTWLHNLTNAKAILI